MSSTQVVKMLVTTNNSPQEYTSPDDQPTTNIDSPGSQPITVLRSMPAQMINQLQTETCIDSPGSQPTTVLLRSTPAQTINQLQTLTHLSHNQLQSFSGVHQPRLSTNYKHWLTWVTTNNSPSQEYTIPDYQPTTNIDSPESQPTTVLLRSTPAQTINQLQTLTHLSHKQQQSFSGLHQPRLSTNYKHWLTWVTTNNSPSQEYTGPDDQPTANIDLPGSQPVTVLLWSRPAQTVNQLQTLTHLGHNQ